MAEPISAATMIVDESPNEEGVLLEAVRRIEPDPKGYFGIHIHLSKLRQQYRQDRYIRIAVRSFDTLTFNHEATLYVLTNSDVVLLCHDVPVEELDQPLNRVRTLFSEDPLTFGEEGTLDDRFTNWYDLSQPADYATFVALVEDIVDQAQPRRPRDAGDGTGRAMAGEPLSPANLTAINERLQRTHIADLIRRQSAVVVHPGAQGEVLFREHYVSMIDLQRRVCPDVNLFGNTWLFQFLTETVDRRLLSVLSQSEYAPADEAISLNLNVSTVVSSAFQKFHEKARERADKVVIELQTVDIFADMGAYVQARDWLQDQGYRVLIDGLNPLSLQFFDPSHLHADFVKIIWTPEFLGGIDDQRMSEMQDVVRDAGKEKVILVRVDSEEAVVWALNLGIRRFQGHYIDRLVEAMIAKGII